MWARTHAELDAEIAAFGEVPAYLPNEPAEQLSESRHPHDESGVCAAEDSIEAGFGWLYRTQPDASPTAPEPRIDRTPEPQAAQVPARPPQAGQRRRQAGSRLAVVALVGGLIAALAGLAGYAGANWATSAGSASSPPPSVASSTAPALTPTGPVLGKVWNGKTEPLVGVGVVAGCVAPVSRDSNNKPVSYEASNLVDSDPLTTWRCNDDSSPSLTFVVPRGHQLAEVGLINGYAQTEGSDDTGSFADYPRVLQVRWQLPDGTSQTQTLNATSKEMQKLAVPVTGPGTLGLEIVKLSEPKGKLANTQAVAIAEVYLGSPVLG